MALGALAAIPGTGSPRLIGQGRGRAMTTTTRPRKTEEERAAEIEALTDRLAGAVEALASSDQWRVMLSFAAKFHRYSPRNILLLLSQAEERGMDLSRVAGFNTWKSLGYMVRRGERSLAVLAPV